MAQRLKIDSNETSLFYAEEQSVGVLPAVPTWNQLEPNEYSDFGGELTLLARNPINSSRQRKKGVITDFDASGGFNMDFTQTNFQDLLQGVMFADFRNKATANATGVSATGYETASSGLYAAGDIVFASGFSNAVNNGMRVVTSVTSTEVRVSGLVADATPGKLVTVGVEFPADSLSIDASSGLPILESLTVDFTDYGLVAGEWIYIGGDNAATAFTDPANNGFKRIGRIDPDGDELIIDTSIDAMLDDLGTGKTIHIYFGRVLKNELDTLVKRRSYQLERQLGAPDTAFPNQIQAEYLTGAIANEFTLNIEQADKINADISFVATDNEQRVSTVGIKAGNRPVLTETDAFNTSSDFVSLRLAVRNATVENQTPLFAYLTDMSITINNNVTPNKAVAVLGAFDVTAGTFEVSGEATAYFTTIEAVQAVRRNADVSLYAAVAKQNAGFVVDMPLIALGDAQNDVSLNEPITLPLSMDAATAVKLNPDTDYTLMWVFFDYLPDNAMPQ